MKNGADLPASLQTLFRRKQCASLPTAQAFFGCAIPKQRDEFLAAEAAQQIAGADMSRQHQRESLDDDVAEIMPPGVVDVLNLSMSTIP